MENFKAALVQFVHSNPNLFPNGAGRACTTLIEQRFSQFFSDHVTPDHPPYAAMIYRAISELNEKGGSSEKSISEYIKKEYADLPWAHSTMLKHHLEKLCERNEIQVTHKHCYSLGGADSESGLEMEMMEPTQSKKHKKKADIQDEKEGMQLCKKPRKQMLKCKRKGNKREKKPEIDPDAELQNNEVTNDESRDQESAQNSSGYGNLNQIEAKKDTELLQPEKYKKKVGILDELEGMWLLKRKRKQRLKCETKGNKREKNFEINPDAELQKNEVANGESHDQESTRGDSGYGNLNEIEAKKDSELLQRKKINKKADIQDGKEEIWLCKKTRKQMLKCKAKGNKRETKLEINADAELQNNEVTHDESHVQESTRDDSGYGNLNEFEAKKDSELLQRKKFNKKADIQDGKEEIWLCKKTRKQMLKGKRKGNKCETKLEINADAELQNNELTNDESHDQESTRDNSGYGNLNQIEAKKDPELLQPNEIKKKADIQDEKEGIRLCKMKRKQSLKCKGKGNKREKKLEINADAELQNNEVTNDESRDPESTRDNSGYGNLNQIEAKKDSELLQRKKFNKKADIQDGKEEIWLCKKTRKQMLKCKGKGNKRETKLEINADAELQNNEVTNDESHDQESTRDNSGYGNLKQIEAKKDPELLQPKEIEKRADTHDEMEGIRLCKRTRKQMLKCKGKGNKCEKKLELNADAELQNNELTNDELHDQQLTRDDSGYGNLNQIEAKKDSELLQPKEIKKRADIHDEKEGIQLCKRKRKQSLKCKGKGNKREKILEINADAELQNNEVTNDESHDQESTRDNSGFEAEKDSELLQAEEPPVTEPVLEKNGKRVWTRSQLKATANGEKPMELLNPISSRLTLRLTASTEPHDPISLQQDKQQKSSEPENDEVLCVSKSAAVSGKSQKSVKQGESGSKKGQLAVNGSTDGQRKHAMTRRSSRNLSYKAKRE